MFSVLGTLMLMGVVLDTGISITLNIFIVMVAAKSMKNGRKVFPPDVIHLVMGLVNLLLQCCLSVQSFLFVLYISAMFVREFYIPMTVFILTLTYFSSWLNALLSSYYFATITNFTHQLFLWFRKMISTSLWLLLSLSALDSFIVAVSSIWALNVEIETDSLDNCTGGNSFIKGMLSFHPSYVLVGAILGSFLPFALTLLSILLTFASLIKHVNKIRQKNSGFTRQAHINAIRRMFLLLTICSIFCICQLMLLPSRVGSSYSSLVTISQILMIIFPIADAIVIIQASSKMQQTLVKTFCTCAGKQ
ncbi:taste receptor type 2 member 2-like [Dendropsophus ebraccatus]|uniref:taste receptor type 2 member 2-like n=1 Tax=Dendropsophus ebraccatus TaxID=150705 RepID=UPI0038314080